MKGYVFDENVPGTDKLSFSLPRIEATQVLGRGFTDRQLWNWATRESLVIVTKDADYSVRMAAASPPPWVVHLRIGNMRLLKLISFLQRVWPQVEGMLRTHKMVSVYPDRIEGIR